jgi:predicted O-methyltransferase YrrM
MQLNAALAAIAQQFDLDADELHAYIAEDTLGGWNEEPLHLRKWTVGCVWEIEAQIIYALIRALKPVNVLEIGTYHGCSTSHICEALQRNGKGHLNTLDIYPLTEIPDEYRDVGTLVRMDLFDYEYPVDNPVDFVFEDSMHSQEMIHHVWRGFVERGAPGGVIITHDSEHYAIGDTVKAGIEQAGVMDYQSYLVEPSKCGLAMWRRQ